MTVKELIVELSDMNPDAPVFVRVNGDESRSGDFFHADPPYASRLIGVTYGGAECDNIDEPSEYWSGESFDAVIIQ